MDTPTQSHSRGNGIGLAMSGMSLVLQGLTVGLLIALLVKAPAAPDQGQSQAHARAAGESAGAPVPLAAIQRLAQLPASVAPEHRALEWHGIGDDAFALTSTMLFQGGGWAPSMAQFKVAGQEGSISAREGERLPTRHVITVERIGDGFVTVAAGESRAMLKAPGGSASFGGWPAATVPGATASAPAASKPESITLATPAGNITIEAPRDPRLPPASAGLSASEEDDNELVFSVGVDHWEEFVNGLRASFHDDVVVKDALDDYMCAFGAEISSLRKEGSLLGDYGLSKGDVIVGVMGAATPSRDAFERALKDDPFLHRVEFEIERGERRLTLRIDCARS